MVVHFCLKYTLKFQELKPLSERKQNKSASMHVKIYFFFFFFFFFFFQVLFDFIPPPLFESSNFIFNETAWCVVLPICAGLISQDLICADKIVCVKK